MTLSGRASLITEKHLGQQMKSCTRYQNFDAATKRSADTT